MVTKEQVLELVRDGETYESAGRRLGIPAGQAYMIATGIPADGSDSLGADDYRREGLALGATQELLGVPLNDGRRPGEAAVVLDWVRSRARSDNGGIE